MSVEETNLSQSNNLSNLRDAISKRKSMFDEAEVTREFTTVKFYFSDVPSVTVESTSEFNLLRHGELCNIVDILYWNWKVAIDKNEQVEERFKELVHWVDEWMFESIKPRFS